MPDTVSVTYIGGHDAVDIPDPSGSGRDIASDVKNGHSVEVPADVAKSLLEQSDNWKRAEKQPAAKAEKATKENE